MTDQIAFLREKARELRELAAVTPTAAAELHRIADDLDDKARELVQAERG